VSRAYPPARFDPPEAAKGLGGATWFRVFRCPACQTSMGRQRIGVVYERDESGYGLRQRGHTIERVELVHGLIALAASDDGMLRFGLSGRAYTEAANPTGTKRRSALRRSTSVLPSVEGGDPYHVARHDPRRARTAESEFVLALSGGQATLACVVTCPRRGCQRHWLVAGAPSAAELASASPSGPPV
jgi:hypothetical protein